METLTFRWKYAYETSRSGIEIPIILTREQRSVRLLAKVDTGASFCIFQREYAEELGIDVEKGDREQVCTATGAFTTYGHPLTLSCLGSTIPTTVYFVNQPNFPRNVLGRRGWLQHFRLGLIDHDAALLLSDYDD